MKHGHSLILFSLLLILKGCTPDLDRFQTFDDAGHLEDPDTSPDIRDADDGDVDKGDQTSDADNLPDTTPPGDGEDSSALEDDADLPEPDTQEPPGELDPDPDPADEDDDYELPPGSKFVWPAPGWITSTDFYPNGNPHSGLADIALPYWTDIGAARGGTVTTARWGSVGGYYVHIDHGDGYKSVYSHLSGPPTVSVGDEVVTGQLLGYAGRTGNALNGGSHLHFSISKDGDRIVVPGMEFGDWVARGKAIEADFPGISPITATGNRTFDVRVLFNTGLRAEPSGNSPIITNVSKGETLTVSDSHRGYYRVRKGDHLGYLGHTNTEPVQSQISSVKITANNANIRTEPSMDGDVVGTLPNGRIVTIFETRGNWQKLLFDLPTTYKWTHTSNTEPTQQFRARIRSKNANIRSGPGTEHPSIGLIPFYTYIDVLEVRQGWYRINHEGQTGWVAGWLTQGRL